jgi:2-hydroxychromene-2-carboxylate isomerase
MIEFFFDCSSPWTYLAFHNIQPLAAELKEEIQWRPVLVGGIFNAVNPSVYAQRENPVPAKAAYMKKDLQDWAREASLKIIMPPKVFPVNSVKPMRGCLWLAPQGKLLAFASAVFEAYWSREEDISQDAVLLKICQNIGVDSADFLAGIAQPAIKEQLKSNTEEVIRRGGFGSPTIFVGDDMYFGNDRLTLVKAALLRLRGAPEPGRATAQR